MIDYDKNETMRSLSNCRIITGDSKEAKRINDILEGCGFEMRTLEEREPNIVMALILTYQCGERGGINYGKTEKAFRWLS